MSVATFRRSAAAGVVLSTTVLGGCAVADRGPAAVTDPSALFSPTSPCGPDITVPQIVSTSPAEFDAATWERRSRFQVHLRFRLDENGAASGVRSCSSSRISTKSDKPSALHKNSS